MKIYCCFIFALLAYSCKEHKAKQQFVLGSSKEVSVVNDVVFYKNQKFSGVLVELNPFSRDTILMQDFKDGLLEGISKKWYPNRRLMEYREYKMGMKNGKQLAFWENGNKRFEFIALNDAYEGELREWSIDGKLFHLAHFVNGQEEGSQKMWYENGKIRANYVIISGKRYGLLGTKNCKNVSNSIFVVK